MSIGDSKPQSVQTYLLGRVFCVAFVVGAGCLGDGSFDFDVGDDTKEVIGGIATTAYPAVGRQFPVGCTGTLIHPHVFLTAAHCVESGLADIATVEVSGVIANVASVTSSPDYYVRADGGVNVQADIAVAVLADPIRHVTPYPIAQTAPTLGRPITMVGYGCTAVNGPGFGTKRHGLNAIDVVGTDFSGGDVARFRNAFGTRGDGTFESALNCSGDSGGPTLWDEGGRQVVSGVASVGGSDLSFWASVFAHRAWIQSFFPECVSGDFGPCGEGGTRVCGSGGIWGACVLPTCLEGDTQPCGDAGCGTRACNAQNEWDPCVGDETVERSCPGEASSVQNCGADGLWGTCRAIEDEPASNDTAETADGDLAGGCNIDGETGGLGALVSLLLLLATQIVRQMRRSRSL